MTWTLVIGVNNRGSRATRSIILLKKFAFILNLRIMINIDLYYTLIRSDCLSAIWFSNITIAKVLIYYPQKK